MKMGRSYARVLDAKRTLVPSTAVMFSRGALQELSEALPGDGFLQIVGVRGDNLFLDALVAGQNDDRYHAEIGISVSFSEERPAVHYRHDEIEQDAIGMRRVTQILQCFGAILPDGDFVALAFQ